MTIERATEMSEPLWLPILALAVILLTASIFMLQRALERRRQTKALVESAGWEMVREAEELLQSLSYILNRTEFRVGSSTYQPGFWPWQRHHQVLLIMRAYEEDRGRLEIVVSDVVQKYRLKPGNPTYKASLVFELKKRSDNGRTAIAG
jgi:hypothetical protein